jgi:riboflavin kinase
MIKFNDNEKSEVLMIIMNIKGTITTGYGKGSYFLGQKFYKSQFSKKCGFIPFPGTLNIVIEEKHLEDIRRLKKSCNNIIKPNEGFGGVKYIKTILENNINGAIIFPDKTTHEENYLEFIAKDNLRKKLNLNDGDEVKLKIILNNS